MTTGLTAPARVPSPRVSKAAHTSTLTAQPTAASTNIPTNTTAPTGLSSAAIPISRAGTPAPTRITSQPGARRVPRAATADPLSDRATATLIRRVLCPEQQLDKGRDISTPIDELLPPLTSRNDVDLQLYALIAIILREYVQKWYNKITPDETFVAETVQIIAHCTRALEQRLRKVDLESLLFDEIPDLVDKHVNTYRAAHSRVVQPPVQVDPRAIYHSMWPLPALSPVPRPDAPSAGDEQADNEAAYRQLLVQGVLALLLPTEDLENECLTALVGQIFSELIIGSIVANRVAEPWLIWECLIILSNVIRRRGGDPSAQSSPGADTTFEPTSGKKSFSMHSLFLTLLQWCFLLATFVRAAVTTIVSSSSVPPRTRYGRFADEASRQKTRTLATDPADPVEPHSEPLKVPVLAFRIWPALSNLVEMDLRMPWLSGTLSFFQWIAVTGPGRVADVDGVIDRYLSHTLIQQHVLDAATLPPLLRSIRGALFPNNAPGVSTLKPPSTPAELLALRRRCASALWDLVPRSLGNVYFGRTRWWPWVGGDQYQRSVDRDRGESGGGAGQSESRGVARTPTATTAAAATTTQHLAPSAAPAPGQKQALGTGGGGSGGGSGGNLTRSGPRDGHGVLAASHVGGGDGQRQQLQHTDTEYGEKAGDAAGRVPVGRCGGTASTRGDEGDEAEEERILSEIESGILDVFGDAYCNRHLLYGIVELVLVRLMPELSEKGVVELLEERLS